MFIKRVAVMLMTALLATSVPMSSIAAIAVQAEETVSNKEVQIVARNLTLDGDYVDVNFYIYIPENMRDGRIVLDGVDGKETTNIDDVEKVTAISTGKAPSKFVSLDTNADGDIITYKFSYRVKSDQSSSPVSVAYQNEEESISLEGEEGYSPANYAENAKSKKLTVGNTTEQQDAFTNVLNKILYPEKETGFLGWLHNVVRAINDLFTSAFKSVLNTEYSIGTTEKSVAEALEADTASTGAASNTSNGEDTETAGKTQAEIDAEEAQKKADQAAEDEKAKQKAEEDAAKAKTDKEAEEARLKEEAEAKAKAAEEARIAKEQAEAEAKAAEEARKAAEEEAKKQAEEEAARAAKEAEEAKRAEEERLKAEAEAKAKAEEEARQAKEKAEAEAKAAEEARIAAEEAKKKAEEEARAAEQAKKEAEEAARLAKEAAEREAAQKAAEEKAQQEKEAAAKKEAEEKAKAEEEARLLEEAKKKAEEEAARIAKEEAKAAEEAQRLAEEEAKKTAAEKKAQDLLDVTSLNALLEGTPGKEYQLPGSLQDHITYVSNDEDVVSVDKDGVVTFHKTGATDLIIKNGKDENGKDVILKVMLVNVRGEDVPAKTGAFITPQMFGAKPGVNQYDTQAIIDAVNPSNMEAYGVDTVYLPAGRYRVDATGQGVALPSDINFVMSDDAILHVVGNEDDTTSALSVTGKENVRIYGGTIEGDRYRHFGDKGEWGMGIAVRGSKNVTIEHIFVHNCFGDGIYIASSKNNEADRSTDIKIHNVNSQENRRNNLSIVGADGVVVSDSTFTNAKGKLPGAGIDIETNDANYPVKNVTIKNCEFKENAGGSLLITTVAENVTLKNNVLHGRLTNYMGQNTALVDANQLLGEVFLRQGTDVAESTVMNAGGDAADELVLEMDPNVAPAFNYYHKWNNSDAVSAAFKSVSGSSNKVLSITRTGAGSNDAGISFPASNLKKTGSLGEGTYRIEYVTKGTGDWGYGSDTTGWYWISPKSSGFASNILMTDGTITDATGLRTYAVDHANGMNIEIESIKVYKVR